MSRAFPFNPGVKGAFLRGLYYGADGLDCLPRRRFGLRWFYPIWSWN